MLHRLIFALAPVLFFAGFIAFLATLVFGTHVPAWFKLALSLLAGS